MHLALTGRFRAKWTAEIHEEWIAALREQRPDLSCEKKPPKTITELKGPAMSVEASLTTLERQGLAQTVSMLREYIVPFNNSK